MCGICGVVYFDNGKKVSLDFLKKMTAVLVHRGPDDEGYFLDDNAGFGHRRLKIIDLKLGHQPMFNEDNSICITYNGEIYNYMELRKILEKKGHRFRTNSDTEVIIHSYEEYDADMLTQFNGMFAFALWDRRNKTLFLARDRFGIKPVYYYCDGNKFLFASEIKAILQDDSIRRALDATALADYLRFQNILGEKTFFKNIRILKQGHYLTLKNCNLKTTQYWDVRFSKNLVKSFHEAKREFRQVFESSVKKTAIVSDVPVSSYLSGGMDSGSICSIASRTLKYRVKSFTLATDDDDLDESRYAKQLSKFCGTTHYEYALKPEDFVENIRKLIWHLDEPRAGTCIQNYMVAGLAGRHAKVVLAGEGGDELFGGYSRHSAALSEKPDYNVFKLMPVLFDGKSANQLLLRSFAKKTAPYDPEREITEKYLPNVAQESAVNKLFYLDQKIYLHDLLIVDDKVNMAHSVEERVPYLDNEMTDFALSLPPSMKIKNRTSKFIVRKSLDGIIPEETLSRPKMGFRAPDSGWFRNELKWFVSHILLSKNSRIYEYFNRDYVDWIVKAHVSGERNYSRRIWSLLNIELWHRIFRI